MAFILLVNLYISRVVLKALGVEDFGIYNVVGGLVTMFGFLNSSMTSATQRYLTFELGKDDKNRLSSVFSTSIQIHLLIAVIVVILSETIGLYFLYNKLQIPATRLSAAFWVLHCSTIILAIKTIIVPYNATVIAHEKMNVYAVLSIIEVFLNLGVVLLLNYFNADKLKIYAVLLIAVQVVIIAGYFFYCRLNFVETKYNKAFNKPLFKEMCSFASWSLFGNSAAMLMSQGQNILLNMFFGPIVNAARGIVAQVSSAVKQFAFSFQTAINPQITKTYASNDLSRMHLLMFSSAKFSSFLLLAIILPVIVEAPYILSLWLETIPDNTVVFVRIVLCTALIGPMANPLMVGIQATGKIKIYQGVVGGLLLLILPVSYMFLKLDFPAYSVFVVELLFELIAQIARLFIGRNKLGLSVLEYMQKVVLKIFLVGISTFIPLLLIHYQMNYGFLRIAIVSIGSVVFISISAYFVGLSKDEKDFVRIKIDNILKSKS